MKRITPLLLIIIGIGLVCVPTLVFGQESTQGVYRPLVELPRLDGNKLSAEAYVQALFYLAVAAAGILAFLKIMYAGIKWMLSDVVTSKESAKKDIWGALFGLAIVLSAVLILTTINPNLVVFDIFGDAPRLDATTLIDQRSHDQIREEERAANPLVGDTYTGQYGTNEHRTFVQTCLADGGRVVMSEDDVHTVECRYAE